jgi:hypothetical protein
LVLVLVLLVLVLVLVLVLLLLLPVAALSGAVAQAERSGHRHFGWDIRPVLVLG